MNASGLLLLLSPLALWTELTAAPPPPPTGGRSLQCPQSRGCPTGHSCVTFRGRRLCGPTAADASTEASGASSLSKDQAQQPVGRPVDQREAGPSGNSLSEVGPSVNPVPSGKLFSTDNPAAAPEPAVPKMGCVSQKNATTSGGKPVSSGQPGEATSAQQPVNGTGHTEHSQPPPCAKPGGKPASTAGHGAHEAPAPGGKPASSNGSVAHSKPTSGHKPAPHGKPECAGKPKPENQPEKDTEKEKEGDDFDDDDDDNDDDSDEVKEDSLVQEGSHDEEDTFDRELDYGLGESPFNPNDYHDAWSDEDSDDSQPGFEEDGPPEAAFGYAEGEAAFDAWGDAVRPPAREVWPRTRSAGFLRDAGQGGGAGKESPAEAPSAGWMAQ